MSCYYCPRKTASAKSCILPLSPVQNMTTRITTSQVLRVPTGELAFTYPRDPRPSQNDKKYEGLRVERRGLRRWNSFQENPACLQAYLDRYCAYPEGWRPYVTAWQRYAASERMVQDVYGLTLIHRVNNCLSLEHPSTFLVGGRKQAEPKGGGRQRSRRIGFLCMETRRIHRFSLK
ncbi:hypothetical protein F5B21DRAFT_166498 [Xylaria acuta]|nr:hypothetical protein F5B21DRAFT_166498 [Xylaria acuta]